MNLPTSFLGWIALISSIPLAAGNIHQVYKIVKRKKAKDLSLVMCISLVFASLTWLIYGLEQGDFFLVAAYTINLLIATPLLIFTIKYRKE